MFFHLCLPKVEHSVLYTDDTQQCRLNGPTRVIKCKKQNLEIHTSNPNFQLLKSMFLWKTKQPKISYFPNSRILALEKIQPVLWMKFEHQIMSRFLNILKFLYKQGTTPKGFRYSQEAHLVSLFQDHFLCFFHTPVIIKLFTGVIMWHNRVDNA